MTSLQTILNQAVVMDKSLEKSIQCLKSKGLTDEDIYMELAIEMLNNPFVGIAYASIYAARAVEKSRAAREEIELTE